MSQSGDLPQGRRRPTGPNALPLTRASRNVTGPQTNLHQTDYDDTILDESTRSNTSVVRYDTSQRLPSPNPHTTSAYLRRRNGTQDLPLQTTRQAPRSTTSQRQFAPSTEPAVGRVKKHNANVHWLLPLGVGMVAMLVLWVFGSLLVAWSQQRYDDMTYGRPRTYQTDAVVGHNDSAVHKSHFIAINYNRQAIVTEWMGGDPAKSINYVVPYYIVGDNSDLTPVTVQFKDVTGHHKLDMVIHIHLNTQDQTFVFVNDGTKFRPPLPTDKIQM
ncbi:MAG: hypothetical protein NVS4B12_25720 [Ktedonobacteraceae bacterium]